VQEIQNFIERWKQSGASERANFQPFITELCDVLELPHPDPASDDTTLNDYTFERSVTFDDGAGATSTGRIDLYRCGSFVMEAKQGSDAPELTESESLGGERRTRRIGTARRGTTGWQHAMKRAFNQARRYAQALPDDHGWPPFLIVTDVGHCIDLYADFSLQGKHYFPFPDPKNYRISLDDLKNEDTQDVLRSIWNDPLSLDRTRQSARVTRELAARLAKLASSLEKAGHAPETVSHFLMQCLFTMFAEDVGLLPDRAFTELLQAYKIPIQLLPNALESLWSTMNRGGFSPDLKKEIVQFNGSLFAEIDALPLTEAQLDLLIEAAEADWKDVEPAIFGTLLERALDPRERHKLGAHFTPRAYVERLVMPTIVEPLREEWTAAQAAAARYESEDDQESARQAIIDFHRRLCSVRVLDPACGSGNFLYVTLEHLKRIEGEVVEVLKGYGGQQILDMTGGYTVSPGQLLGLEINPRAAAIADVVLWIGYLQWHLRTVGDSKRLDPPILKKTKNIRLQDAVLAYDERIPRLDAQGNPETHWDGRTTKPHPVTGEEIPDETERIPVYDYTNSRIADWPDADFIVGNPPYIGKGKMREALGDGYTEALRSSFKGKVSNSSDYVMYWWHKAAEAVRKDKSAQFGFITTNSLRQVLNRRVVKAHLNSEPPLSLCFVIPDHPWVDAELGAAVRISMTVGRKGNSIGRRWDVISEQKTDEIGRNVVLRESNGKIAADLTTGTNVNSALALKANDGVSNPGVKLHGAGFITTSEEAARLGLGKTSGLEAHIRYYRNGRDLTAHPRNVMVIDLFGLAEEQVRSRFPQVYQWLLERVKPERDAKRGRNKDLNKYAEEWWLFGKTRPQLRNALQGVNRYIATVETSKHRFFQFLDQSILPDNRLIIFALDDAYFLGILSSRIHVQWALATGGTLEDRPVYNKTRCFELFPFPNATNDQRHCIRQLAEALDTHRKTQLAAHDSLTMTNMYNVLKKLRDGEILSKREKEIHELGLVGVLKSLHDDLDESVAQAYGWPTDLSNEDILQRLVDLNHERAEEESKGHIRYLRPSYQNPEGALQQDLGIESKTVTTRAQEKPEKRPWPRTLPDRIQAVQSVLGSAISPMTADEVAAHFKRAQRKQIRSLLETLTTLGHAREIDDGCYMA